MAKYFTDFSENPIQSGVPAGWTQRVKAVAGDSINIATDATMGRVLKLNKSGTSGSFIISNDQLDGVSDLETLSLFKVEGTGQAGQFGINYNRFSGTSEATTNGMRTSLVPISNVNSLVIADAGVGIVQYTTFPWSLHTWYWARFRTVGTTMKSKVWAHGTPEPANWNIETTYSKTIANPYSGLGTFVRNNSVVFAQYSAGTDGDTAPMTDAEDTGWVSAGSASGTPLVLSDFDFNLPLDAVIEGIELEVLADGSIDATAEIMLSPPASQNTSISISNPGSQTVFTRGHPKELWGGVWSRNDVNNLSIVVQDIYKQVYIYELKVKVYYKLSGEFPVPESSPIVGFTGGWGGAFNSFGSALQPSTHNDILETVGNIHSLTSSSPIITQAHLLGIDSASHLHKVDGSLLISQINTLGISNASHLLTSSSPSMIEELTVVVNNTTHAINSDNITLTQTHILNTNNTLHSHTVDGDLSIVQAFGLAVDGATHSLTSSSPVLVMAAGVAVQSASHSVVSDNITLAQINTLSVDSALHSTYSDSLLLAQSNALTVDNTIHSIVSDVLTLVEQRTIAVQSSIHSVKSDNVSVIQGHTLTTNNTLHGLGSDTVSILQSSRLLVSNTLHSTTSSVIDIIQYTLLGVPDSSSHGVGSEELWLAQNNTLDINSAINRLSSSNTKIINWDELGVGFGLYRSEYIHSGRLTGRNIQGYVQTDTYIPEYKQLGRLGLPKDEPTGRFVQKNITRGAF